MQRDPNKRVSARGEIVDFELLRIKQEMSTTPTTVKRERRPGRRRKLSDKVKTSVAPTTTEAPQTEAEAKVEAPKIVRKTSKGSS